jgi:hypothetical protein
VIHPEDPDIAKRIGDIDLDVAVLLQQRHKVVDSVAPLHRCLEKEIMQRVLMRAAAGVPCISGQAIVPAQAATPDLQGIWAQVSFPGFGRPLTGAGPVVMKNSGPNGPPRGGAYAGDDTNPILKPQAAEIVKRHADLELSGIHAPSPRTECWPTGVPLILANSAMQLIQHPTVII